MQIVPLYPETPLVAVQTCEKLRPQHGCDRCGLSRNCKSPQYSNVMPKKRGEGGEHLLVVAGVAPANCSRVGQRGFSDPEHAFAMKEINARWPGTVVYDYALRCTNVSLPVEKRDASGKLIRVVEKKSALQAGHYAHCRPYLSAVFHSVKPTRVILLGNEACKGFLGYGRGSAASINRGGYSYIHTEWGAIPAYLIVDPTHVFGNTIRVNQFKEDLDWATGEELPDLPPLGAVAYDLDPTEDDADLLRDFANQHEKVYFDAETYGHPFDDDFLVLSIGLSFEGSDDCIGMYADAAHPETPTGRVLNEILTSDRWEKGGQNVQYDVGAWLAYTGNLVQPVVSDSRLGYKLINSDGAADLDNMGELVGMGGHKEEAESYVIPEAKRIKKEFRDEHPWLTGRDVNKIMGKGSGRHKAYAALPREVNIRYVCRDALAAKKLAVMVDKQLQRDYRDTLWRTYQESSIPSATAFALLVRNGVPFSTGAMDRTKEILELNLHPIRERVLKYMGPDANPSSGPQKAELLYGKLGLKPPKFTAGGEPSTDKNALKRLVGKHPVVADLLELSKYDKLVSTYVTSLPLKTRDDGRIRPGFILDGTRTGRISVTDGLHQIPTRTKEGKYIKSAFRAPKGRLLLQMDYSTLEVRVAAILSGDPVLTAVLNSGLDMHTETAKMIAESLWRVSPEEIEHRIVDLGDKSYRTAAKKITFGTLYGESARSLAEGITEELLEAGITTPFTENQADAAQEAILGKYNVLRQWIHNQQLVAREHGCVWTWWDGKPCRRRWLLNVTSQVNPAGQASAMRSSYNTPIQGTGSEFCIRSVNTLVPLLDDLFGDRCKPVLTVHDSTLFDIVADEVLLQEAVPVIHSVMAGWNSEGVKMPVDAELGVSWGQMRDLPLDGSYLRDDFCLSDYTRE